MPYDEKTLTLIPDAICWRCSHWITYQYKMAGKLMDGWRCTKGVVHAGARLECFGYEREAGSDDE
jgi:hypothetical protein